MLQTFNPQNANLQVWVGDRLWPRDQAKVSVFDSAVQGGDAVWEGLRLYANGMPLWQIGNGLRLIPAQAFDETALTKEEHHKVSYEKEVLSIAARRLVRTALLVAENAAQIRHMVTNKLILETDNPDPRVRIRALELLGKISDVGLFAEKSEVTVTHQSTEDLRLKLRSKLAKLINPEEDSEENVVIIDSEVIDVAEELGLEK